MIVIQSGNQERQEQNGHCSIGTGVASVPWKDIHLVSIKKLQVWGSILLRPQEEEIAKSAINASAQVTVLALLIGKCQIGGLPPKGVSGS